MSTQIPLSLPRDPEKIETAFAGDAMDREAFAERITPALRQLSVNGGVLTLDAPWGEGKSWFGRHWRKMLDDQGQVQTCWIDAFEQDYIENPFELVAAELVDAMGWRDNEELLDKTVSVMTLAEKTFGAVAKGFGRALGIAASAHIGTSIDAKAGEAVAGAAADFAAQAVADGSAWLKGRLLAHSKEKQAIRKFREEMQKQLAEEPKPMVVFVDELDRCRPDFAVRLLECIKHFFDVPNLVFVLLLNREQLEKAVKGIYGAEVDAHLYLHKFIHLPLRLPKGGAFSRNRMGQYIQQLFFERFRCATVMNEWIDLLPSYAVALNLSLRDLERIVPLLVVCPLPRLPVVAFALCLKVKSASWFDRFQNCEKSAWQEIDAYMRPNLRQTLDRNGEMNHLQQFMVQWLNVSGDLDEAFFGGSMDGLANRRGRYHQILDEIGTGFRITR